MSVNLSGLNLLQSKTGLTQVCSKLFIKLSVKYFDSVFLQYSLQDCGFDVKEAEMLNKILSQTSWIQSIK